MSYVQDRISRSTARVDAVLAQIEQREAEAQERADAKRMMVEREQSRADSEKCRQAQIFYDDAFRAFGVATPPPVEGERPGRYRMRLFEYLRKRLPSRHELSEVRADDIPGGVAARNFESMMISAAMAEALKPSPENLPRDGSLIRRERTDEHGARSVEWLGRRSFIADMGRNGGRVLRIMNPKNGQVLMGEPLPKAW
jgi:hypothetical protein